MSCEKLKNSTRDHYLLRCALYEAMPYASKCPDRFKIAILDGELRITQYAATEINPDGADTLFEEFGTLRDADNQKAVLQQVEKLYNITNSTMEYADYNGSEILILTL